MEEAPLDVPMLDLTDVRKLTHQMDHDIAVNFVRFMPLGRFPCNNLSSLNNNEAEALLFVMDQLTKVPIKVIGDSGVFALHTTELINQTVLTNWIKWERLFDMHMSTYLSRLCRPPARAIVIISSQNNVVWESLKDASLFETDKKALKIVQFMKSLLYTKTTPTLDRYAVDDAAKLCQNTYNVNGEGPWVKPTQDFPMCVKTINYQFRRYRVEVFIFPVELQLLLDLDRDNIGDHNIYGMMHSQLHHREMYVNNWGAPFAPAVCKWWP